jgi:hypothetical protein
MTLSSRNHHFHLLSFATLVEFDILVDKSSRNSNKTPPILAKLKVKIKPDPWA